MSRPANCMKRIACLECVHKLLCRSRIDQIAPTKYPEDLTHLLDMNDCNDSDPIASSENNQSQVPKQGGCQIAECDCEDALKEGHCQALGAFCMHCILPQHSCQPKHMAIWRAAKKVSLSARCKAEGKHRHNSSSCSQQLGFGAGAASLTKNVSSCRCCTIGKQGLASLAFTLESHALDAMRILHIAKLFVHAHDARLCIQADGLDVILDQ